LLAGVIRASDCVYLQIISILIGRGGGIAPAGKFQNEVSVGRIIYRTQPDDIQKAREIQLKLQLARAIRRVAGRYGVTQREMALHLNTSEACISRLMSGKVEQLSYDQLMRFLTKAAPKLEILVAV